MPEPVCIYALCEPDTGAVRYIGMTVRAKARYSQHLNCFGPWQGDSRKTRWMQDLARQGKRPVFHVLAAASGKDARQQERVLILSHRAQGCNLLNTQPYTEEEKQAMRRAARAHQDEYMAQKQLEKAPAHA